MERMWSPWRSEYIDTFRTPKKRRANGDSIFTAALKAGDDKRHLIIWRSEFCFVIMNRYPYNSGHLMVVPNRQTTDILDLTAEEMADLTAMLQRGVRVLQAVMSPQGFNIGLNLGRVAGAGVDDHVHVHIVPRWNGDVNFMPVIGDTKVISEDIRSTYKKLYGAFRTLCATARPDVPKRRARGRVGRSR